MTHLNTALNVDNHANGQASHQLFYSPFYKRNVKNAQNAIIDLTCF